MFPTLIQRGTAVHLFMFSGFPRTFSYR